MQPNPQLAKKKRLLNAAGIFALPVIAVIIAVISLTTGHKKPTDKAKTQAGFNTSLPAPNLPKDDKNKLEVYMQAQLDSTKLLQEAAKDPYIGKRTSSPTTQTSPGKPGDLSLSSAIRPGLGVVTTPFEDDNEKKVNDRLQKIYAALGSQAEQSGDHSLPSMPPTGPAVASPEISRLEKLMQEFQKKDTAGNPQLEQVSKVLDKIMDIQHPDRVAQTAASSFGAGVKDNVLPVQSHPLIPADSTAVSDVAVSTTGFFGLDDNQDSAQSPTNAIEAVVHTSQVVQTGSIVKLRLLQPIYIGGEMIPANSFIYGPAAITGERVTIQLTNAICGGRILPISMSVYDGSDGLLGLYVPGMITRDVVKQGMSQGVQSLNIGSLDPSLGAQAAAAGIATAQSLLSRKISLVKATLKAGHLAILKSSNEH